ncbi:hypothetical protein [Peribacillus sp. SI8-4]|uniref:hypothetical protein n=1 Tax=Peribacillus sp. SI8-4 TaxID=3048009 RepID=UPI002554A1DC|nr:hypothetical protein [Peribacillus sp. SI8-4]
MNKHEPGIPNSNLHGYMLLNGGIDQKTLKPLSYLEGADFRLFYSTTLGLAGLQSGISALVDSASFIK